MVLVGGEVHNGDGTEPVVADVAIRGDRIVAIGDLADDSQRVGNRLQIIVVEHADEHTLGGIPTLQTTPSSTSGSWVSAVDMASLVSLVMVLAAEFLARMEGREASNGS